MSFRHLARQALSLPPHIALKKTLTYGGRIAKAQIRQVTAKYSSSYSPVPAGGLETHLKAPLTARSSDAVALILAHRFDLLGSGWCEVPPPAGAKVSPGNKDRSRAIGALINSGYTPIDWQLDFKSGYRWREDRLSGTLRYGHEPGVDVKVPWELGRLQHLSWLALEGSDKSAREFRNQILDFAAANPPGYGVNWLCTMDVAIRAANLLIAYDLFVARDAEFDDEFLGEFHALVLAHGKHIASHLEWHDLHRANHYLADIAGLFFVAAYLPRSGETDAWMAFAVQQLIKEVDRQFTPDGANFEASTSYHRLSSEMVVYATALVLGLPDDKKSALSEFSHRSWKAHPSLEPAPLEMYPIPGAQEKSPFPGWYFERLERMAEFMIHVTKPNGRIAQIGDDDSGRFFKLCPSFIQVDGEPKEQHLDHRSTVAAINGLFNRADFAEFSGPDFALETACVRSLAGSMTVASYLKDGVSPKAVGKTILRDSAEPITPIAETVIEPPDPDVLLDLMTACYPDFGLFIWRSDRFFLSVCCGPVGQNGNGGHAHNDQLAIELNVGGEDWIADPGTYLYTPSPDDRNAYRSVHAHAAPRIGDKEPSRLDLGLFRLEDNVASCCLRFDSEGFEGVHQGYGIPLHRRIAIERDKIRVTDLVEGGQQDEISPVTIKSGEELRKHWGLNLPFSPGYGLREKL